MKSAKVSRVSRDSLFQANPKSLGYALFPNQGGHALMLSIRDLHDYFIYEDNKPDKALNFDNLKDMFSEHHHLEVLNDQELKLNAYDVSAGIEAAAAYNVLKHKKNLSLIITAHGGPSWFFGPMNEYFLEKIGLVWRFLDGLPEQRHMQHAYFMMTYAPKRKLYFVPAGALEFKDTCLNDEQLDAFEEIFYLQNLYGFDSQNMEYQIEALNRAHLSMLNKMLYFSLFLEDSYSWVETKRKQLPKQALFQNPYFLKTADKFYLIDADELFDLDINETDLKILSSKLPKKDTCIDGEMYKTVDILSKAAMQDLRAKLNIPDLCIRRQPVRASDFAYDECFGMQKVCEFIHGLKRHNIVFSNIILFSCYTALEFCSEPHQQMSLSSARLLSMALPQQTVLGCIGRNADVKTEGLLETMSKNNPEYKPVVLSLLDSMLVFKSGLVIRQPEKMYYTVLDLKYLTLIRHIIFDNQIHGCKGHPVMLTQRSWADIEKILNHYNLAFANAQLEALHAFFPSAQARNYTRFV